MASVLSANELRKGVVFNQDGKTWKVIDYKHIKMGRTPATVKVKVQDIEAGVITEKGFNSGDSVQEADVAKRTVQFLYSDDSEVYFMDSEDFSQFSFPVKDMAESLGYLKEGQKMVAIFLEDRPISVEIPKSVELEVIQAQDAVAGDSANNPTKKVVLETGMEISVPLFIKTGDKLKINTDTAEYVGRV